MSSSPGSPSAGARDVELSHDALDTLPASKSIEELRAALVHAGVLPPRDELLAGLARWTDDRLGVIAAGPDHTTLRAFATWKIQRELTDRRRRDRRPDVLAATMPKHWIGSATDLTAWLHQQGATLAELDQARLDQWLVGGRWRAAATSGCSSPGLSASTSRSGCASPRGRPQPP